MSREFYGQRDSIVSQKGMERVQVNLMAHKDYLTPPKNISSVETAEIWPQRQFIQVHRGMTVQTVNVAETPGISKTPEIVIVTKQPSKSHWQYQVNGNQWKHELCDFKLFDPDCLCAFCCFPCYTRYLTMRTNESSLIICCVPFGLMHLRTKIRTRLKIRGSICEDYIMILFCLACSVIQMSKELRTRKIKPRKTENFIQKATK